MAKKARQIVVEFTKDAPNTALSGAFLAYAMQPEGKPEDRSLAETKTEKFFVQWLFVESMHPFNFFLSFKPFPGMKFSWEEGGDKIVIRDKEKIVRAWFWAKHIDAVFSISIKRSEP